MISINTKLKSSLMVHSITDYNELFIKSSVIIENCTNFQIIESIAQTIGLHARYSTYFEKHAFVLSIKNLDLPKSDFIGSNVELGVKGILSEYTDEVYNYLVEYKLNDERYKAEFNIGLMKDENDLYDETNIMMKERFKCLIS